MPRAKTHKVPRSPEVRAAVIAALLAGQSVTQVAKEYKLPKGTVSNWKHRNVAPMHAEVSQVPTDGTQKQKSIGDLLDELVRANLKGLIAVASLLEDRDWLKEQGAAELGTIAGITNDKTIRMLEAMGGEGATTADAPPVSP